MYYHGEEIGVNVHIANSSSRTCKKIKVTSKRIGGKKYSKFIYFGFLFVSLFFSSSLFVFFSPLQTLYPLPLKDRFLKVLWAQQCSHLFTTCMCLHCGILRKPQAL